MHAASWWQRSPGTWVTAGSLPCVPRRRQLVPRAAWVSALPAGLAVPGAPDRTSATSRDTFLLLFLAWVKVGHCDLAEGTLARRARGHFKVFLLLTAKYKPQ